MSDKSEKEQCYEGMTSLLYDIDSDRELTALVKYGWDECDFGRDADDAVEQSEIWTEITGDSFAPLRDEVADFKDAFINFRNALMSLREKAISISDHMEENL